MVLKQRFLDQVVIVTGAAQGIGKGVAEAMAAEGAKVVLVDRSDLVDEVAKTIHDEDGKVLAVKADLETYAGAVEMVRQTLSHFGSPDVIVNNVGGTIWAKPFDAYDADQIEAEIRRSLFPTLWCCRAVLPSMIERKKGVIVNISSIATTSIHRIPYAPRRGVLMH